jgi:hypothetical protein
MIIKTNIREYTEAYEVEIVDFLGGNASSSDRLIIRAYNEGHNNVTEVDLLDVIKWVKDNKPELICENSKTQEIMQRIKSGNP